MGEPGERRPTSKTDAATIFDADALRRQIQDASKPDELGVAAGKAIQAGREGTTDTTTVEGLMGDIRGKAGEFADAKRSSLDENPSDPDRDPRLDQLDRITNIHHKLEQLNTVSANSPTAAQAQEQRRALRKELEQIMSDPQSDTGIKHEAEIVKASMQLARNLFVLAERHDFTFDSVDALNKIMQAERVKVNEKFGPGARTATVYSHDQSLEFHATIGGTPSEVRLVRSDSKLKGALFSDFELRVQPSEWAPVKAAIEADIIKDQESNRAEITRWINLALNQMVDEHPGKWPEKELDGVQKSIQTRIEKFLRAMMISRIPTEAHVTRSIPIASGILGLRKRSGTIDITITKECQVIVQII